MGEIGDAILAMRREALAEADRETLRALVWTAKGISAATTLRTARAERMFARAAEHADRAQAWREMAGPVSAREGGAR